MLFSSIVQSRESKERTIEATREGESTVMKRGSGDNAHEQFLAGEEIKLGRWDHLRLTLERPKLKG